MAGKMPAARLTDMHACPLPTHVGGPIAMPGASTVLICTLPAARIGDMAICGGPPDALVQGAPTVLISRHAGIPTRRHDRARRRHRHGCRDRADRGRGGEDRPAASPTPRACAAQRGRARPSDMAPFETVIQATSGWGDCVVAVVDPAGDRARVRAVEHARVPGPGLSSLPRLEPGAHPVGARRSRRGNGIG